MRQAISRPPPCLPWRLRITGLNGVVGFRGGYGGGDGPGNSPIDFHRKGSASRCLPRPGIFRPLVRGAIRCGHHDAEKPSEDGGQATIAQTAEDGLHPPCADARRLSAGERQRTGGIRRSLLLGAYARPEAQGPAGCAVADGGTVPDGTGVGCGRANDQDRISTIVVVAADGP